MSTSHVVSRLRQSGGYKYVCTQYRDGRVIFTIRQEPDPCRCSSLWLAAMIVSRGRCRSAHFRSLPIGSPPATTVGPAHPGGSNVEPGGWSARSRSPSQIHRRGYTHSFERYAPELSRPA